MYLLHKSILYVSSKLCNQGTKRTEILLTSQGAHSPVGDRFEDIHYNAKIEKYIKCYGSVIRMTH